jgi:8-oxo-dGTP pyrophosphatase MutT (NUDIX family)
MILNEMFGPKKIRKAAGCLIVAKSTGRFCVNHRSQGVNVPNTWGTWGGEMDPGEDARTAAKREMAEETEYSGPVEMIPLYVFKDPAKGYTYYNFLAVVDEEFEPELNWESQGFRWVEYGDWPNPLHPGLKALLSNQASQEQMLKFTSKTIDEDQVNEIYYVPNPPEDSSSLSPEEEKAILAQIDQGGVAVDEFDLPGFPDLTLAYIIGDGIKRNVVAVTKTREIVCIITLYTFWLNNKRALIISAIWTSPHYRGKNLGANIYTKLSTKFNAIIVSDDIHYPGGRAIWTKKLPEMGIHPVPVYIDINSGSAYVSNVDPYSDLKVRLAFKTGTKNLRRYLSVDQDDDDDDFSESMNHGPDSEEPVNEILQMADSGHSDDFMSPSVERMLRSMLKYERFQNYDLPGFPDITVTYITLSGSKQRRAVVLDDEDEFVVSISFSEQMLNHKKALVASTIWTHPSYRGKNLTANIYQMLSKELDVVIVSDDTHWPGAVAIWTRKLPEMGEYVVPLFIDPDTGAAHVSGGDPYEDHRLRWAFKTGVKNLQQYLKSTDIEHKQVTEFTIDVIEDFTQRAKPGSRPGSLRRKAGKGKDEKITASDLKRLKSRANRMKQSDNAETRKRGVQLARQVSWYRNFHK